MSRFFHSLRWRLQLWHALILLLTVVALCATVLRLATIDRYRRIDQELDRAERDLVRGIIESIRTNDPQGPAPSPEMILAALRDQPITLSASVRERFSGTEAGYFYFIIQDPSGQDLLRSDNAPLNRVLLPATAEAFHERHRTEGAFRENLRTSREGLATLVGRDMAAEQELLATFTWSLTAAGLGVWLAGLLGGWWLAGRAIKPIAAISATATRIAEGNLRERISITGTDNELDQLSQVLNSTFERLQAVLERQRRFTADAAHELRTPVTILLTESQRILRRVRTIEEYQGAVLTCRDAAERMRRLTEALLLLARQEAAADDVPTTPIDLSTLAADAIQHLGPLAKERHVELVPALAPGTVKGDGLALGVLINNLVANAIQHHFTAGGQVWVTVRTTPDHVVLEVRDDGRGIPDEHLPRIFERFHRVDQARTGGTPHTGLGLAIAQIIATNHGATLTAANVPTGGAVFTTTFPAA